MGSSVLETIRTRRSVRTYDGRGVPEDLKRKLAGSAPSVGPFGHAVRFTWVLEDDREQVKDLGTYGMIKDASDFIAGMVLRGDGERDYVDFGYCMERVILAATETGLGTCWLGGTFDGKAFRKKAGIREGEIMPAVASVGYPADTRRFAEKAVRLIASSDARKKPGSLFFDRDPGTPLDAEGGLRDALEAVRHAPSATNRQPWRIVRRGEDFLFYCADDPLYAGLGLSIQSVDMGIAMCHFELVCSESGMKGGWLKEKPERLNRGEWRPIAVWKTGA